MRKRISSAMLVLLIASSLASHAFAAVPHEDPDTARQTFSYLSLFRYYSDSLDFVLGKAPQKVESRLIKMPYANLPQSLRTPSDTFTSSGIELSYLVRDIDLDVARLRILIGQFRLSESIEKEEKILSSLALSYENVKKLKSAIETTVKESRVILEPPGGSSIRIAYDEVLEKIERIKEPLDLYKSLVTDLQAGYKAIINKLILPTELSLKIEPEAVFVGDSVQFEGRLTSEGKPLAGKEITLLVNGTSQATALTDNSGYYKGSLRAPYWYISEIDLQALYLPRDRDLGFYISSISPLVKLKSLFYKASLEIVVKGKAYPGLEKEILGKFDYGPSPVPEERRVEIYLDDVPAGKGIVGKDFSLAVKISPEVKPGNHTITLSAAAAGRYAPAMSNALLNISQAATMLYINIPGVALIPGRVGLDGKLRSELGPLKNAKIKVAMGKYGTELRSKEDGSFDGKINAGMGLSLFSSETLRIQVLPQEPWNSPVTTTRKMVVVNAVNSGIIIFLLLLTRNIYSLQGFKRRLIKYRRSRKRSKVAPVPTFYFYRLIVMLMRRISRILLELIIIILILIRNVFPLRVFKRGLVKFRRSRKRPKVVPLPAETKPIFISVPNSPLIEERVEPTGEPRHRVFYFYRLIVKLLQGIARIFLKPHQTLREFAREHSKILGPLASYFLELTKIVEKLLYSKYSGTERDVASSKQLSQNIEEGLKSQNV